MTHEAQPAELSRVTRIIDMKLPLQWLLGVAFAIACSFATMYFKLEQLGGDMTELKISVKAGNGTAATIQGELAILKFRIENLEHEKRAAIGGVR